MDIYGIEDATSGLVDEKSVLEELGGLYGHTVYDGGEGANSDVRIDLKDGAIPLLENGGIDDMFQSVPIIGIRRHRLLTDGNGITTLVAFHGCSLACKYCLNPQCRDTDGIAQFITPRQLYDRVKIDDIYFQSSGGGIVFGGGEPLLYTDFINQFHELCLNDGWKLSIESSLNVNPSNLLDIISVIDEFIVDIKDIDPHIYKNYTGVDNTNVIKNLELLKERGLENKVYIRVPLIQGYNDSEKQNVSISYLKEKGFSRFDRFSYVASKEHCGDNHIGKAICEVLKNVRKTVADANGIEYSPEECQHTGNCSGTCPKCDKELELLTEELYDRKSRGSSINL